MTNLLLPKPNYGCFKITVPDRHTIDQMKYPVTLIYRLDAGDIRRLAGSLLCCHWSKADWALAKPFKQALEELIHIQCQEHPSSEVFH